MNTLAASYHALRPREFASIKRLVPVLRSMVVLLLAALWLPASSHVLLEHAGVVHAHYAPCHSSMGGSSETPGSPHEHDPHDAADGQCLRAVPDSGASKAPTASLAWSLADAMGLKMPVSASDSCGHRPPPPGTAPPHLHPSWTFLHRVVMPARPPNCG